ncbi:hypothetical protein G6F46_015541 [Rhizopus delemar]|nr:hypothetical protein G6F35_018468 [Rhizopus arrhizus]KAG1580249.1 hypothetical protein G6F46_015541 [Rhizopus delemar]
MRSSSSRGVRSVLSAYSPTFSLPAASSWRASSCHCASWPSSTPASRSLRSTLFMPSPLAMTTLSAVGVIRASANWVCW